MHSKIRFIHSADLHLDSLFKSKGHLPEPLMDRLRSSTFEAFDRLVEQALHYHVDFVLIVGDLFNEKIRSLKAQVHLRRGLERLHKKGIEVFISYGNHDYIQGVRYPVNFPDNVHIFSSQEVSSLPFIRNGEHVANIYGFSYETREVRERKIEEYVQEGNPSFHIATLHGSLETNMEHDVYAPFLLEELYEKNMDYWALGHIHQRQILSENPPVVYPGNIQGRSRKEQGEKGCYLMEWKDSAWERTFLPLQSFTYETVTLPCDHLHTPQEIEQVLEAAKQQVESPETSLMLDVLLTSTTGHLKKWQVEGIIDEWVEIVNDVENLEGNWIWIDEVRVVDRPSWNEDELIQGSHFTGELLREVANIKEEDLDHWMAPLFKHRRASKFINPLSSEEKQEAVDLAKTMTLEHLLTREDSES